MAHEFFKTSMYRYAPETFSASFCYAKDKKHAKTAAFFPVSLPERGKKSFEDLKRIVRKQANEKTWYTYGFTDENNPSKFYCIPHYRFTNYTPLLNRFLTYKQIKEQFTAQEWKTETSATATLNGKFAVDSVTRHYERINPRGLVLVRLRIA